MSNFLENDLNDEKNNERLSQAVELAGLLDDQNQTSQATAQPRRYRWINSSSSPIHDREPLRPVVHRTQSKQTLLEKSQSRQSVRVADPAPPVTTAFVEEFNKNRGITEYAQKAKMMMRKTRILAGMQPFDALRESGHIDIPSARKNFAILAQLDNHQLKTQALDNLILMMRNDELRKDTAFDLIPLAVEIMRQMDRELMQTQLIEVQIKICTVYSLAAELIQSHYGKRHLGGITKELKEQLTITAKNLEDLNAHNDTQLHVQTSTAYEGVRRLIDDRKALFEMIDRLIHAFFAVADVFLTDGEGFTDEAIAALGNVKLNLKHSWYDHAHVCNILAKKALSDHNKLALFQGYVEDNWRELDWKYLYSVIDNLTDITLNGKNELVRRNALAGSKTRKMSFSGLVDYLAVDHFKSHHDFRNIVKFKKAVKNDYNVIVRRHVIEQLEKIAREAPDAIVRKTAKLNLLDHYRKSETDKDLLEELQAIIPKGERKTQAWLHEIGPYQWKKIEDPLYIPLAEVEEGNADSVQEVALHSLIEPPVPGIEIPNITIAPPADALHAQQPKATHPGSKRPPSILIKSVGDCLGVDVDIIRNRLAMDGNILPIGEGMIGLKISEQGMRDISHLVRISGDISIMNFERCQLEPEAFEPLAEAAKCPSVIQLKLDSPLHRSAVMALSESIIENDKLEIVLGSPKDYVLLGHALEIKGYTKEAISYYRSGLRLKKHAEMDDPLRSKLYYRLGKAHILNNEREQAIEAWKKALKRQPESVPTLLYLSRFLIEAGDKRSAKKYATKAVELQPNNQRAKEFLESSSEPFTPKQTLKRGLLGKI